MPNWNQIRALWNGLTKRQQILIIAGSVLFAGMLYAFVQLTGKDDFRPLYSGLAPGEGQAIARRLDEQKIPYELPTDGTSIRVPASKLDAIRLDMASQGLPQSGRLGFELFDQPNWAGSDFAEKVNYQRALEGELERTIQTVGDVEAVRVHLVLPRESLFTERESEAKASVVIKPRGGHLSDDSIYAITHLVASAVEGLQPENVSLVDADGRSPMLVSGAGGNRRNAEPDVEMQQKLVDALTPVVGEGRIKASVTVDYDYNSTEITNEAYDPNQTAVLTSQVSEEHTQGAGAQGIPGTTSNVPSANQAAAAQAGVASSETQMQRTENKTFGVSRTVKHTMQPAGQIKRIAAAVLIDDAEDAVQENGQTVQKRRKRTQDEMQRIQDLAAAAIGVDTTRGDKLAVQNLSFETLSVEKPAPPTILERWSPLVLRWMGLVRYAALLLLFCLAYLLVLRPVKKQVLAAFREVPKRLAAADQAGMAAGTMGGSLPAGSFAGLEGAPGESQRAVQLKRQLMETVRKEPAGATKVVQNWIGQGEGGR